MSVKREDLKHRLISYFSYIYAKLPWFFQKPGRGPDVAPLAALDYCQGGTVSLRKTGVLLAVMAVMVVGGVSGVRGQDAQNEVLRRAKSKVQPVYPELARKMNL